MTTDEKLDLILARLEDGHGPGNLVEVAEKKIDSLGRITLPIALRRELEIDDNTHLKIYRNNDEIIIKKD